MDGRRAVETEHELEEHELIERALDGDAVAYADLVMRHQPMALRVAYLITGDATEAEDISQEAFVRAHRALSRFRVGSSFRPWLLAIVRNEALNRVRGRKRRERLALRTANDPIRPDATPSPETMVAAGEEHREVIEAVERLPIPLRDTIALRYLLELDEREVAAVLGVPVGTVKSRTWRALQVLRRELGEVHQDDR